AADVGRSAHPPRPAVTTGSPAAPETALEAERAAPLEAVVASEAPSHAEQRIAVATQWQLIWWRFRKHKLALEGTRVSVHAEKLNIIGTSNVVEAALDAGVRKVLALSTDKAVNPVNLYGATKLAAEKLVIQSNAYAGGRATRYSCVRYGNVVGSRGSVVPLFLKQRASGRVTITDARMTRFWLSLEQGVHFVINCIEQMEGGEVFVPKIPSTTIVDLAKAIAPEVEIKIIGIRPGEKLHEVLISEDEARNTVERESMFIVKPPETLWKRDMRYEGEPLPDGFRFSSDTNAQWLDINGIKEFIAPFEELFAQGKLEG
ncbi:MAG TPA: polysaccharide biosynthesis protein, partial [Anaerolineales bacterium]|nr:polysaccharide biosynthesis protein [Anaerolineales bacterium]